MSNPQIPTPVLTQPTNPEVQEVETAVAERIPPSARIWLYPIVGILSTGGAWFVAQDILPHPYGSLADIIVGVLNGFGYTLATVKVPKS